MKNLIMSALPENLTQKKFCELMNIKESAIKNSSLNWTDILAIGKAHEASFENLKTTATMIANTMQSCGFVHSVRWRVKEPLHLMEKVIRKTKKANLKNGSKYASINSENYHTIITDLVGVRALHLFKNDFIEIHEFVLKDWEPVETPIYYYREGDFNDDEPSFREIESDFDFIKHNSGYRSLHYIIETSPTRRKVFVEIQVRTLFEEAWSEIDHKVRYPNFSDDELLKYFLNIFNRQAGSADEMGSFVQVLANQIEQNKVLKDNFEANQEEHNNKINKLMEQLETSKGVSEEQKSTIRDLRKELAAAKNTGAISTIDRIYVNNNLTENLVSNYKSNIPRYSDFRKGLVNLAELNAANVSSAQKLIAEHNYIQKKHEFLEASKLGFNDETINSSSKDKIKEDK